MLKANDPNLASATVGFASWRENTTLPYCRQDEEFLNNALLPIYSIEDDAFLAYDNPVPENREEIRADVVAYVGAGVMTRNEGRQRMGEEQVDEENANKLLVPAGLQPIDRVGEMPAMGPLSFTMGGSNAGKSMRGEPDGNAEVNAGKAGPRSHAGGLAAIKQSEYTYARHQHKGDDTARDGEKEKLIREMTGNLNAVFAKQRRRVEAALRGDDLTQLDGKAWGSILMKGETPIMAEINSILAQLHQYNPDIAEAISPYINAQLAQGGAMGLAEINLPADTFSVTNPRVAEFLDSYSVRLAGKINDYSIERLSATLADGVSQGESASALAQRVGEVYDDFSGYRSEMIARTESARAYVAGSERAWVESGVVEKKKWLLASAACPICSAIAKAFPDGVPLDTPFFPLGSEIPLPDGRSFKVDYTSIMGPPGHPHCLLPDTLVSSRGVVAALRAWYSGNVITVRFASGAEVTVTENHKFLTPQGFVYAKSLCKGSDVIGSVGGKTIHNPDRYERPTKIADIFSSLRMSIGVSAGSVPSSPKHLHGDGIFCDGNIDIVSTKRLLGGATQSPFFKHGDELPLCAGWGRLRLNALGDTDTMLVGLSLAANGIMRGLRPSATFALAGVGHAVEHALAPVAWDNATSQQHAGNNGTADTQAISGLLNAFSRLVALDKVVSVDTSYFSGHVYDLQTESGLYNANGVITSNCRCGVTAIVKED